MTAPSPKDALEIIANFPVTDPQNMDAVNMREVAKAALSALPPDGERREAIARIIAAPKHNERARFVQGFLYGDDHVIRDVARREKQELFRTKDEAAYEQRLEIERAKFTADALIASGLVPPDPTTSKKEVVGNERREAIAAQCADIIIDNAAKKIGRGAIHTFIRDTILASGLMQDEAAIRADEREKCAKIAEGVSRKMFFNSGRETAQEIAAAIRSARDGGEK